MMESNHQELDALPRPEKHIMYLVVKTIFCLCPEVYEPFPWISAG